MTSAKLVSPDSTGRAVPKGKKAAEWRMGPLSPTKEGGKHHVEPRRTFYVAGQDLPVTNSLQPTMTPEEARRYAMPQPFIREGADHSHIKSKGW